MLIEYFFGDNLNVDRHAEYEPIVSNTSADIPNTSQRSEEQPPVDRYNIVYWIFTLQGISILLSWNGAHLINEQSLVFEIFLPDILFLSIAAFITASEFFYKEFEGSPFKDTFQNYFSIVSMVVNLICLSHALYVKTTVRNLFMRRMRRMRRMIRRAFYHQIESYITHLFSRLI